MRPEPADLPARLRGVFPAEQIIETHISSVFLTLEYAYEVKKPVDLGCFDFRTLARRPSPRYGAGLYRPPAMCECVGRQRRR